MIPTTKRRGAFAAGTLALLALTGLNPASGQIPSLGTVVSPNPVDFTPNLVQDAQVPDPAVYALRQSGTTMYAGGAFHEIENSTRTTTYVRDNLYAFTATTGAVSTTFTPSVTGGPVSAIVVDTSGSVFIGGDFNAVNGVARPGLAKLTPAGVLDTTFVPKGGKISELALVNGRLIVGGRFGKSLAALNPSTGKDTGYIKTVISGSVGQAAGPTRVYKFAVNPAGDRLVAIGNFTSVDGTAKSRAFMLDLGASVTLDPWYYQPLQNRCRADSELANLRDVDFSSDGSFFVFDSTGWITQDATGIGRDLCDAAARFDTDVVSPDRPVWINYSGGDTFQSIAVTGNTVYVQGHFRYLDNPYGNDSCGPTGVGPCTKRTGIAALNAADGSVLPWAPGKSRNVGGKDLLVTSAGLWVASDGKMFGPEYRFGIALAPLS